MRQTRTTIHPFSRLLGSYEPECSSSRRGENLGLGFGRMGGGARSRARAKKRAEESRKAYEARERKKPDEAEPLLYLCTFEIYRGGLAGYRVQVIRLSDLFIPSDTPITIFCPKSQAPKSNSTEVLRQVAYLDGEHVPGHMGFGVLGSRIVLAGGWFLNPWMRHKPKPTYVLETDQSVEPNPRFISTRGTPNPKPPYMIPELEPEKPRPWMREIDGKLYALSGDHIGYAAFEVFDPKTDHVWAPLPKLPIRKLPIGIDGLSLSSCAVVGTKILITLPLKSRVGVVKILCFDVAHPERSWTTLEEPPWWQFHSVFPDFYNEVLVLDLEDDDCEKLLFTYDFEYCQIRVSSMKLSNEGEPKCIQPLDEIDLPDEFKNLDDFLATSYSCAHLGGRRVCFSFVHLLTLLVFTFEFSYSTSGIFSVKPWVIACSSTTRMRNFVLSFWVVALCCNSISRLIWGYFYFGTGKHTSQDPLLVNEKDKLRCTTNYMLLCKI